MGRDASAVLYFGSESVCLAGTELVFNDMSQVTQTVLIDGRFDTRTHGTDHTLRLARQAGIWTARYVWRGERFEEES